jgi:outer membrane protein OmpA-like peptidoglycan-associated protein
MVSQSADFLKSNSNGSSRAGVLGRLLAIGVVAISLGSVAKAQQVGPQPTEEVLPSKVDIYGGYGYIRPFGSISQIDGYEFQPVGNPNATVSITDYFYKNLGIQLEGGYFNGGTAYGKFNQCLMAPCTNEEADPMYYTLGLGPVLRFPKGRFVPFVHGTFGPAKVNGPYYQPITWGEQLTMGGGADYVMPFLGNHFALRGQADVVGMHVSYGGPLTDRTSGGVADLVAFKASGGLVLRLGSEIPPPPVTLACSVAPMSIFPGDPVTVTGTATGLNPKKKTTYTYTSTGGTVTPAGETATIVTTGLAPGSYTVSGTVTDGPKPRETANCSGSFTVKQFEPPTLSCSASPSTLMAGDTSTITSSGVSPQNRQLTYSYSSSSGQISGSGATATLSTAGLPAGTIDITCNVVDDVGQKATAQTSVVVQAPVAPPQPTSQSLCSISFDRDTRRPTRVDNEGKACLDDLALSLQRSTDATLDVVGNAASTEKDGPTKAAERAVNTKDYLVKEKGIDASRVAVFTGTDDAKTVTTTLVPTGAAPVTATPVDETAVKPQPRKPLGVAHHGRKHHHTKQ